MPAIKRNATKKSESENSATVRAADQWPVRRILRSQINPAEYNPRSLSEYARKQLAISLKEFRLAEVLVWNERTGNLVGGHQRLSILDREYGYPGTEYSIEVAVVDLDLKDEKRLNVYLNNRAAQGNFEKDAFAEFMASMPELTLDDIGFTVADIEFEFGDSSFLDNLKSETAPVVQSAEEIAEKRKKMREHRNEEEAKRDAQPESDADYYLMEVFDSATAKEDFLRQAGFPNGARFLSHREREAVGLTSGASSDAKATIDRAVQQIRESEQAPDMPYWRALELIAADWMS